LASGFSISPIELPLKADLFISDIEPFYGNFGIFEDSLPDGYGRHLLKIIMNKQQIDVDSLTPLQFLTIARSSGMGALYYLPESYLCENIVALPALDEMQQMALNVLSDKTDFGCDILYFGSSNAGGSRPKCMWSDDEGEWLVKFRHIYDPEDMGRRELYRNVVARKCGINVSNFKLMQGKYFASKRFDIEDGERLHVATAGALISESILDAHYNAKSDYRMLLQLTNYLTHDNAQNEEMFRRMTFNVLTGNNDDHIKNFSYICRDGKWSLAPAYDLISCENNCNNRRATLINNSFNPTIEDMLIVGECVKIPRARAIDIIRFVAENCEEIKTASKLRV
ncbi:MAG: type II toxin-antitoxin system HipA family toxin, partial [Rikenellaceae bacterium]